MNFILRNKRFLSPIFNLPKSNFSSLANIHRLGVVGAGQMGTGIGIVGAWKAGLEVTFVDPSE